MGFRGKPFDSAVGGQKNISQSRAFSRFYDTSGMLPFCLIENII